MTKIWCDETDCWYNHKCKCKAKDILVYESECISCRFSKPKKGEASRNPEDVRKDRAAKKVADKIMEDLLERMNQELNHK